jgi:SAM-dependent methyltransferase
MIVEPEWWRSFFSGIVVDMWLAAVDERQTRQEAEFVKHVAGLFADARIIDVPCGAGRIAMELAAGGFQVTGVDIAPAFLDVARAKAGERGLPILWEQRDMRDLPWPERFDAAVCWGGSFGYFDDGGNAEFLRALVRTLKSGGRLILDASKIAEIILPRYQERSWMQLGDILFLERNSYDYVHSRLDTEYTFIHNGKAEKRFGSERIYTFKELSALIKACGLELVATYGSLNLAPFTWGSPALYIVAEKPGV